MVRGTNDTPTLERSFWSADGSEPVLETTIGGALREAAARVPDHPALISGVPDERLRCRWTYGELLEEAERVARALVGRFSPGERVAVWAPNLPEWVILEFGAALAGIVLVTVNPAYRSSELAYVLRQSRSSGIFLVREYRNNPMAASLEEVRAELPDLREIVWFDGWDDFVASGLPSEGLPLVRPDDAAQIQYTSGTTGPPKGAVLHHRGMTNNGRFSAQRLGITQDDVYMNCAPMFHTGGSVLMTLGAVQNGAAHLLVHAFDPALVLELMERERVNAVGAVPTMLSALLEHPDSLRRDTSSLRVVFTGSSPVFPDLVRQVEQRFDARVDILYGLTEASPGVTQTTSDDPSHERIETVGRPFPQTEVRIVDTQSGSIVPINAVGELCVRGCSVMKGYFDMPEATAKAIDGEGWLHTGDLASMDENGYVKIVGRAKDMIIRGGENVYPREIEEALLAHPAVAEVAVVGVPDEKWGEQIAAFIRPADLPPSEDELFALVRERLAPYKTPRHWIFVEEFPRTPLGKIQKFLLREQAAQQRTK